MQLTGIVNRENYQLILFCLTRDVVLINEGDDVSGQDLVVDTLLMADNDSRRGRNLPSGDRMLLKKIQQQ